MLHPNWFPFGLGAVADLVPVVDAYIQIHTSVLQTKENAGNEPPQSISKEQPNDNWKLLLLWFCIVQQQSDEVFLTTTTTIDFGRFFQWASFDKE
jgi:hypothetical protein